MKLTMLGTGNAAVTRCYNTCFVLTNQNEEHFLVDGGGGNGILRQLQQTGILPKEIHHIFVTHQHIDHVLGIIWLIRLACQRMAKDSTEQDLIIYAHQELAELIYEMCKALLPRSQSQFLKKRVLFQTVGDGETRDILGRRVTFFDIHSTKTKQFGFTMLLENEKKLTCCGDEPYREILRPYAVGSQWLLHEAFCLSTQAEHFHPYEKHHSTAKDAAIAAQDLAVENLLLYHTEDETLAQRKESYIEEGRQYFRGNIIVPEDLEEIQLC